MVESRKDVASGAVLAAAALQFVVVGGVDFQPEPAEFADVVGIKRGNTWIGGQKEQRFYT